MDTISVDSSQFPLIFVSFPDRSLSDEEMAAYLQGSAERLKERTESFAIIVEARAALSPRQRHMQADFFKESGAIMRELCVGQAYIMTGTIARGVLTALFWMAPPPFPWKIFESRDDAERWARERLDQAQAA